MINIKDADHSPSMREIGAYIGLILFEELCQYMDQEYRIRGSVKSNMAKTYWRGDGMLSLSLDDK